MEKYQALSNEMFAEMMKSDKGISEAHFPVTYCDKYHTKIGQYVSWPTYAEKWDISPEQKKVADEIFAKRREEQLEKASRPGVLCLKTMGGDFTSHFEDGVGNYRVRGRFYDKSGNRWFVEFHAAIVSRSHLPNEGILLGEIVDETFNENDEKRYNEELDELEKKYGSFNRIPHEERPKFPDYKHEHFREEGQYARNGILKFINKRFGTNFTEIHLEEYFFTCDEVVSKCK